MVWSLGPRLAFPQTNTYLSLSQPLNGHSSHDCPRGKNCPLIAGYTWCCLLLAAHHTAQYLLCVHICFLHLTLNVSQGRGLFYFFFLKLFTTVSITQVVYENNFIVKNIQINIYRFPCPHSLHIYPNHSVLVLILFLIEVTATCKLSS